MMVCSESIVLKRASVFKKELNNIKFDCIVVCKQQVLFLNNSHKVFEIPVQELRDFIDFLDENNFFEFFEEFKVNRIPLKEKKVLEWKLK